MSYGKPEDAERPASTSGEGVENTETATGTYVVMNRLGLHARAATKLVLLATRFPCEITISREGQSANAKSVMGVLLLCGSKGTKLTIHATGQIAAEAVRELGALIENRFGEAE